MQGDVASADPLRGEEGGQGDGRTRGHGRGGLLLRVH